MRSIVVSMQNMLLSEAVARTLAETGEFRVEQVLPGKTSDTFSLCRVMQADILLMEVSRLPAYTLENRLNLIACVRAAGYRHGQVPHVRGRPQELCGR